MAHDGGNIEDRLDRLERELHALEARLDGLANNLLAPSPAQKPDKGLQPLVSPLPFDNAPSVWVGNYSRPTAPDMLSGVAVVCFLLVIALVLRTLTDNEIVNRQLGAFMGIAYAAILVFSGCWAQHRRRRFGSLYVICGAFLLFSIVFETHSRFHVLPASAAYGILAITLVAMSFLGGKSNDPILVSLGIVGASLTGIALDFPAPAFPELVALLLLANWTAYAAARVERCSWIKWIEFVFVLFVWLHWSVKAHLALSLAPERLPAMGLPWLAPELGLFAGMTLCAMLAAVFHRERAASPYEIVTMPVALVVLAVIGRTVVVPYYGSAGLISAVGIGLAAGILLLAVRVATQGSKGLWATPSLLIGALVLFVPFVPVCLPNKATAALVGSVLGMVIGLHPRLAKNKTACIVSHLFQGFVCATALQSGILSINPEPLAFRTLTMAMMAAFSMAHYLVYRQHAAKMMRTDNRPLSFDPAHWTALVPLVAALVYAFGVFRLASYGVLIHFGADEAAFQASQSVFINLCALALGAVGVVAAYEEVLTVAIAVSLLGAAKVFLYDLSRLHGFPVLVSVSSFGAMAALGAVLWARWQKRRGF